MSRTIDNRVVEMSFDNSDFEKNVRTSMNTLSNLNKSIDATNSANGLSGLANSIKGFNLDSVASAATTITSKFSALGIIGVTALQNITNQAIETGKRMIESLTIEPISEGFKEYELKMGSVQTIMAGTGESLETVNKYLEELNTYSDKTIYSFSDMTSAIGKFTNNGVKLEDAVKAIQGISNEAALSGANAEQASHAMYNFAQALSAGYVKLIDWKSIENANMATKSFKEQLIETALELGTVVKQGEMYKTTTTNMQGKVSDAFDATKNFNDSLAHQWMTTDVLTKTLARYADETTEIGHNALMAAQDVKTFTMMMDTLKEAVGSGWAQSFEIIFGDFEEAKTLWTDIAGAIGNVIEQQSNARNELLNGWDAGGGRTALINAFATAWERLKDIIEPVKKAFEEVFPPVTAQKLIDISKRIETLTSKFKLSGEASKNLHDIFKGLFSIIDLGITIVGSLGSALAKYLGPALREVSNLLGNVGRAASDWADKIKATKDFNSLFDGGLKSLAGVYNVLKSLLSGTFSGVTDGFKLIGEGLSEIIDKASDFTKSIKDSISNINETIKNSALGRFIDGIKEKISSVKESSTNMSSSLTENFSKPFQKILENFANGDFDLVFDMLNGTIFATIALSISKISKAFTNAVSPIKEVGDGFKGLFDTIKSVGKSIGGTVDNLGKLFEGLTGYLVTMQKDVQASIILKIATAIGILAASCLILASIDDTQLTNTLSAVTALLIELMVMMKFLDSMSKSKGLGEALKGLIGKSSMSSMTTQIIKLSVALLILSVAMKNLSTLDWDGVAKGLASVTGLMLVLMGSMGALNLLEKNIKKVAPALITIAIAFVVFAEAMKILGTLSWEEVGVGITSMVGILFVMVGAMASLDTLETNIKKNASAMITMGIALTLFAAALKIFASVDPLEAVTGITAMTMVLVELALTFKLLDSVESSLLKGAASMAIMGIALNLFAASLKIFSSIDPLEAISGITAMTLVLVELALTFKLLDSVEGSILKGAVAITIMGIALNLLALSLKSFSSIDPLEAMSGITAMTLMLVELSLTFMLLDKIKGKMIGSAVALTIMGVALNLLASSIVKLSGLNLEEMLIALGGLGLVLIELAIACNMMNGAIMGANALGIAASSLMLLAQAIKVLSSIPVEQMAIALVALAASLLLFSGLAAALSTLAAPMTAFASALASVGAAMLLFSASIALIGYGVLSITEAILNLIEAFKQLGSMKVDTTAMQENFKAMMSSILQALEEHLPTLGEKLGQGIATLLEQIFEFLSIILTKINEKMPEIIDVVVNFIIEFVNAISARIPDIALAAVNLMIAFIDGVVSMSNRLIDAAFNAIITFINGLSDAIEKNTPKLSAAMKRLFETMIKAAVATLVGSIPFVKVTGEQLMDDGFLKGLKEKVDNVIQIGKDFVAGFIKGIKEKITDAVETAKKLGKDVLEAVEGVFDINSPSKEMEQLGKYTVEGFVIGLRKLTATAVDAAEDFSKKTLDSLSLGAISDVVNFDTLNPVITPVLDLTNVQSGANQINSMLSGKSISATVDAINQNGSSNTALIESLKEEIVNLGNKMSSMQMVLDSGMLVGELAPGLDQALGQRAVYAGRGN